MRTHGVSTNRQRASAQESGGVIGIGEGTLRLSLYPHFWYMKGVHRQLRNVFFAGSVLKSS